MTQIKNTAVTEKHPEWRGGRNPGALEEQERRSHKDLMESDSLPVPNDDERVKLELLGITFGPQYEDGPLFCDGTLPEGWKMVETNHPFHTDIVDEAGKVRAHVFYKAAFYDRKCSIHAKPV